jgi:hypothetical protein
MLPQPLLARNSEGPVDLKSINLGPQQISKAEADQLLEQNADWEVRCQRALKPERL